jgi:adenylate kinase
MSSHRLSPDHAAAETLARHDRTAWLKGGKHHCLMPPHTPPDKARRIVLLGASGVEKDAVAGRLGEHLGACHLSIRDVFSAAKEGNERNLSPATQNALDHLKRGEPVSDETVLSLVGERLRCLNCAGGFLLDGFPRTVTQAKALEQLLESHELRLTAAIHFELPGAQSDKKPDQKSIQPLIEFYHQRGQLLNVSADGTPEEICQRTLLAVLNCD